MSAVMSNRQATHWRPQRSSNPFTISSSARPFFFGLIIVSSSSAKALHLRNHLRSLGPLDWMLLLPFFFLPDIALAILGRLLLDRGIKRWGMFDPALILGFALAVITTVAAAMEIAFYWETTGEIDWHAANKFLNDSEGIKLLFSGTNKAFLVLALLVIVAKVIESYLYNFMGNVLLFIKEFSKRRFDYDTLHRRFLRFNHERVLLPSTRAHDLSITRSSATMKRFFRNTYPFTFAVLYVILLALYIRKTYTPYKHLMGSLPFTLVGNSELSGREFCADIDNENHIDNTDRRPFPLADLTSELTADQEELSKGWSPWNFISGKGKPLEYVHWLPREPVTGFQRWYNTDSTSQPNHYDPRFDPLRISNNDLPILDTLKKAFQQHNVVIKNVMMITLESMRKDVFPFKKSSDLHKTILSSHDSSANLKLVELLANISRTSELLTGEGSGFESADETRMHPMGSWRNPNSNLGGLNVISAISSSTYTLKTLLTAHCGVNSLPVDYAAETYFDIYQPCLPHILELFNARKDASGSQVTENFHSQMWDIAYLQTTTDQFDHQSTLMKKIGFSNTISDQQLEDSNSKFYPPTEPKYGYWGYADGQIKPYVRDIIETARDSGRRFFISQLTCTTHHPWELPTAFGRPHKYMGHKSWLIHEDLNNYLNTIKYSDVWLQEMLEMLEDTGVANETLVVVAGDHGFGMGENDLSCSTIDGAHINNFKIPIVFHHPKMPRVQLKTNATTMSILPTILDLLASTDSLDKADQNTTSHLVREYEGQSLIREYKSELHGRQNWQMSVINPGGRFLAVSSAATPWRLVMPLCTTAMFRFTDLSRHDLEEEKLEAWSIEMLKIAVARDYGADAAKWVVDAEAVGTWWFWETRRLWKFGETRYGDESELPGILDRWLNRTTGV